MPRKKKNTELLDEELNLDEDTLDLDDEDEEESSEEELQKEPAAEISADITEDEETKEPEAPKPAPRKRAAKAVEVEAPLAAAEAVAPVAASTPTVAEKDAVVLQWEAAKQASESIVASLEKVNDMLREIPEHYSAVIQKSMKQAANRPTPAARIAFGMSVVATLLSVLSLSFSQSARQMAVTRGTSLPAIHHSEPREKTPAKIETAESRREAELMALVPKPKVKRKAR